MEKQLGKKYSVCDKAMRIIRQHDSAFRTAEDKEKIEIITSFAGKLVAESQDIEPEYVKVVDKKFWDLF